MIRLLQWLVFGHVHKWREDSRERIIFSRTIFGREIKAQGVSAYCTCEKCGVKKRFDLS